MTNSSAANRDAFHLDASPWKSDWTLPEDVTYLNHGSFGPAPKCVQETRREFSERLESQPMQFFVRDLERLLDEACEELGGFVGAPAKDLIFVDNATFGMNIVAASVDLQPGDEVLLTDHEYGAVVRIWRRKCQQCGAKVVTCRLPFPLANPDDVVAAMSDAITDRTRLIVVSHVTSPTAVVLPVEEICRVAKGRGVSVCIDGPHAVAMLPLELKSLGCDFYAASCHKWLSAPLGSGFLYVSPQWQGRVKPAVVSWGGSLSGRQPEWRDEFRWLGTRDPAAFLSVPMAMEFLRGNAVGSSPAAPGYRGCLQFFRERGHELAAEFCRRMEELTGLPPFVSDVATWKGMMAAMPLPALNGEPPKHGQRDPLQDALWERHRIEIPVVHWQDRRLLRVSCHLYNDRADLDRLTTALEELLPE